VARESALSKGLRKWAKQGGDLRKALPARGDSPISTEAEVEALCAALDAYRANPTRDATRMVGSPLFTLTTFFQEVATEEAQHALRRHGLARLRVWVEDALGGKPHSEDDILFILKILGMYGEAQDVDLIAKAARYPIGPEAYIWSVILAQFEDKHPQVAALIAALKEPLPQGFIRVAFLDMANAEIIAGRIPSHPLDTILGHEALEAWFKDTAEEHFSYAHSATAALPFIDKEVRQRLLAIARTHPSRSIQLEAAWAQVKSGDESGLVALVRHAGDPIFGQTAQSYLEELGHADKIPQEAQQPDFQALSAMAAWLAHPMEYGRPPKALEIFDSRVLYWPPTDDERRLWLIKYTYENKETAEPDRGIGMVGSVTFALFGEATCDLIPEELYGLHCCWELKNNGDPRAPKKRSPKAGIRILVKHGNEF
jgi:hypothetical protein